MNFFNKKRIKRKNYKLKTNKGFTPLETVRFNKFFSLFKMRNFKKDKNNKNMFLTGFTLIETFVAITVLIISIVGPFTLVMKGLAVSKATKGQITAMYLAQEAIESIRNIRDENILNGSKWLTDLNGTKMDGFESDGKTIKYKIDPSSNCVNTACIINAPVHRDVTACNGDCPPLEFHPATKIYGYDLPPGSEDSILTRTVEIEEIPGYENIEVIITVTMKWNEGPRERDFVVSEHLLNWQ